MMNKPKVAVIGAGPAGESIGFQVTAQVANRSRLYAGEAASQS